MVILSKDSSAVDVVIQGIRNRWEIKDLDNVNVILELQVTYNRAKGTLKLCQSTYIENILDQFKL
jgi:hypothetical protein